MALHAIEIILTRTVCSLELRAAERKSDMSLAPSGDSKNIAVLVSAKNENRAVQKIWKRLEDSLPIDVVCSLFPGPDGKRLMSIQMSCETAERLRIQAETAQQSPETYLGQAILEALARDRSQRKRRLDCRLNSLMRDFSAEEIAGAAARRIA
ncbi:hypothetical protein [Streptomyces sp. NBC_01262]|uniref:hypothetical protein n=1 Tax=Streptomyces sp. NBC_01262 TaxID=2903803 RepID=UPI002E2FF400|nr:hypothetical protein [Streptomyces sp. NBC_01262]